MAWKQKFKLSFLLLFFGINIYAQSPAPVIQVKDSTTIKKRFWRASGELMLVQLIPWSYNYFIRDADFAHISFASIGHNLKPSSWEFDDNNFTTNQFAHPYEGNLYFNSFRTNGYSFWQAAPAALVGSFMWEVAGETNNPAPNDLINTSFGGIILGEMTYRVSNRIINKQQRGFKRQLSEVAGFLIDPMNGLNRILDGKWGKVTHGDPSELDTVTIIGSIDLGARVTSQEFEGGLGRGNPEWYTRLVLMYGDPYVTSKTPFSYFDMTIEAGDDDSTKLNVVRVNGLLASWRFAPNSKYRHELLLTANYDFYHNSSFEYGAESVNFDLYSKFNTSENVTFNTIVGTGAVILAAVPDAYLYYGEGRNYDYGPGFNLNGSAGISTPHLSAKVVYKGGWFTTINGYSSTHFLHTIAAEFRYTIVDKFSIAAENGFFILHGNYRDYSDVDRKYSFLRFSLGYSL